MIAACILAFFRRPYRRHLAIFGALLPLGVIAQAILGALVVKYDLRPELVMGHFILSMLLLDAGFALFWCSRYEPWDRRRSRDRKGSGRCGPGAPRPADDPRGDGRDRLRPPRRLERRQFVKRFTFEGLRRSNGWSSATPSSRQSTASPRSPSGSSCAAPPVTAGR